MAYLEDYKMDPTAASPLMTFTVFDDLAAEKDLTLVRADIVTKGIDDKEGSLIVESLLENYRADFSSIQIFNKHPDEFDFEDFLARMNVKWNESKEEQE